MANLDRRLSLDFSLSEFRGWETATPAQIDQLQRVVNLVLQPARRRFGPIIPTSWIKWSSGIPRTGPHATGGAVDFVARDATVDQVFAYVRDTLPSSFGTLIHERDHVHVTAPGVQGRFGMVLLEPEEGVFQFGGALGSVPAALLGLGLIITAAALLVRIRH